jgi:hypothetical protein
MNMVETWSAGMPSVMPSVEGQHGQELAGAKGNGDILTIPNWQIFPTILKLLKKCDENAPS